jgi:DNA-binding CsgD family transcriptional regulator
MASKVDGAALQDLARQLAAPLSIEPGADPVFVGTDVLATLMTLVPADAVAFCDLAPRQRSMWAGASTLDGEYETEDDDEDETDDDDRFWDHFWSGFCSYPDRSGDWASVTRVSDFCTLRVRRQAPAFSSSRGGFDREMLLPFPSADGHSRRILFLRQHGCDFNENERALAAFVRPHLAAYLHALDLAERGIAPLTNRQRELMSLVAAGHSNAQVGRRLGITTGTVRAHLQQIYTRLSVHGRGEAVALLHHPADVDTAASVLVL